MIVNTAELRAHLDDPAWIVFDCRHDLFDFARGAELYRTGHVPGAFFAPVETALSGTKTGANGRHPLPEPGAFAEFLARHGVTPDTTIVAYDDVGGQYAARLWWMTRWIGLRNGAVLDGGYPKWVAEGHPVSAALSQPRGGGDVVAHPDDTRFVRIDEVAAQVRAGAGVLLDARAPERHRGEAEPIDIVAGRIPAARNRFFKDNLNADQTMRSPAELRRAFEDLLAGRPPGEVVHHCGSGVTACVNLLAMEHAGLTGSRLYPGSWSEWIADPARPVERG